jgi:CRP-like cAMP-binding protein
MPQPIQQPTVRNRLLAALPPDAFAALAPALQPVGLGLKQSLYSSGRRIGAVHFPDSGMVSLLAPLAGGELLEVGVVGREGLVGLPVVLDEDSSTTEALVQAPGAAWRVRATALRRALEAGPALKALLLRYVQAFHAQVAQTAACNARHPLEERFPRWLLMAHDRVEGDAFPLTQEFAAMMLGVRRPSVSVAAAALQKAGVIAYAHGQITVLDRAGLEAVSCECYGTVRAQFERLPGGGGAPATGA